MSIVSHFSHLSRSRNWKHFLKKITGNGTFAILLWKFALFKRKSRRHRGHGMSVLWFHLISHITNSIFWCRTQNGIKCRWHWKSQKALFLLIFCTIYFKNLFFEIFSVIYLIYLFEFDTRIWSLWYEKLDRIMKQTFHDLYDTWICSWKVQFSIVKWQKYQFECSYLYTVFSFRTLLDG